MYNDNSGQKPLLAAETILNAVGSAKHETAQAINHDIDEEKKRQEASKIPDIRSLSNEELEAALNGFTKKNDIDNNLEKIDDNFVDDLEILEDDKPLAEDDDSFSIDDLQLEDNNEDEIESVEPSIEEKNNEDEYVDSIISAIGNNNENLSSAAEDDNSTEEVEPEQKNETVSEEKMEAIQNQKNTIYFAAAINKQEKTACYSIFTNFIDKKSHLNYKLTEGPIYSCIFEGVTKIYDIIASQNVDDVGVLMGTDEAKLVNMADFIVTNSLFEVSEKFEEICKDFVSKKEKNDANKKVKFIETKIDENNKLNNIQELARMLVE